MAMLFESEVSMAKAMSAAAMPSVVTITQVRGRARSYATSSRNSIEALTRSTRPSGHSVNNSATPKP